MHWSVFVPSFKHWSLALRPASQLPTLALRVSTIPVTSPRGPRVHHADETSLGQLLCSLSVQPLGRTVVSSAECKDEESDTTVVCVDLSSVGARRAMLPRVVVNSVAQLGGNTRLLHPTVLCRRGLKGGFCSLLRPWSHAQTQLACIPARPDQISHQRPNEARLESFLSCPLDLSKVTWGGRSPGPSELALVIRPGAGVEHLGPNEVRREALRRGRGFFGTATHSASCSCARSSSSRRRSPKAHLPRTRWMMQEEGQTEGIN